MLLHLCVNNVCNHGYPMSCAELVKSLLEWVKHQVLPKTREEVLSLGI